MRCQPSGQGTGGGRGLCPIPGSFSYLSSVVSVCPLPLVRQKEHMLLLRMGWGGVGQQRHLPPCYHGRTLEAEAAPCWQCAGASTLSVPEPSPFSLMTLQLPHVPQGRCAEGATVGLYTPPHTHTSPRAFGSAVKARVGVGMGVANNLQFGRAMWNSLERSAALPVASAQAGAQKGKALDIRHGRPRSKACPQLKLTLAGVVSF